MFYFLPITFAITGSEKRCDEGAPLFTAVLMALLGEVSAIKKQASVFSEKVKI